MYNSTADNSEKNKKNYDPIVIIYAFSSSFNDLINFCNLFLVFGVAPVSVDFIGKSFKVLCMSQMSVVEYFILFEFLLKLKQ